MIEERIDPIIQVLDKNNLTKELDPDEVKQLVLELEVPERDYDKLVKTMIYIRQRFIYRKNRYEAFKIAFPERFDENLTRMTIETKARRVEEYKIYKRLVALLSTSLYISYALDRMDVLDLALNKIRDDRTKDRDRIEYMKVFLQETRKPENTKELEVNVNIQNNEINIASIENKMEEIGSKLNGLTADKVLEVLDGNW